MGKKFKYTPEMDNKFIDLMSKKDLEKVTIPMIKHFTKDFNDVFHLDKKPTEIAAHFRTIKTKLGAPVKIAFAGISDTREQAKKIRNVKLDPTWAGGDEQDKQDKPDVSISYGRVNICTKVTALLKEITSAVTSMVSEHHDLKNQLRDLADLRAAVERYQKKR